MLDFHVLTMDDQERVVRALKNAPSRGCEYSFANNLGWRRLAGSQVAWYGDFYICCALDTPDGTPWFAYPAGTGDDKAVIEEMRQYAAKLNQPLYLWNVTPERLAWMNENYPDQFTAEENRGSWDYLYEAEELAELGGRKFHQKRNFLHRFDQYHALYTPLTERDYDDCIQFAAIHYNNRFEGNHSAVVEQFAIDTFFRDFETLGLHGGVLRVDGKMVAFTVGEPIRDDTFCVHIEKADMAFDGAYAAINQRFAEHIRNCGYTYINREEDMGIEGLRRAKQSYHPCMMQEKWFVKFK